MWSVHDCNWSALNIPIFIVFNEDPEIVIYCGVQFIFSNVVGALHLVL